jgi:hypothetical protein
MAGNARQPRQHFRQPPLARLEPAQGMRLLASGPAAGGSETEAIGSGTAIASGAASATAAGTGAKRRTHRNDATIGTSGGTAIGTAGGTLTAAAPASLTTAGACKALIVALRASPLCRSGALPQPQAIAVGGFAARCRCARHAASVPLLPQFPRERREKTPPEVRAAKEAERVSWREKKWR